MIRIYKEDPNVISNDYIWIAIDDNYGYMYEAKTLLGLLLKIIIEWKQDKNMIG